MKDKLMPNKPVEDCGIELRVSMYDWEAMNDALNNDGYAVLTRFFNNEECDELSGLYNQEALFRSRIYMARHGFGKGEYSYLKYPLPDLIHQFRQALLHNSRINRDFPIPKRD